MIANISRRIIVSGLLLTAAASAASCNTYLFEQKCPDSTQESQIKASVSRRPADILFVVDNSGSMADEQENLALNFEAFISAIGETDDYQIMVVTTDVDSMGGEKAGRQTSTFADNDTRNVIDIDGSACMSLPIEHGCARGSDPERRIINSRRLTREERIAAFQDNVMVGSCGSPNEAGLAAMIRALEQSRPGGCNEGFLRAGANLVVVIVSDEEDFDPAEPDTLVDQYATELARFKDPAQTRVATIVGSVDGVASRCRVPNTGDCGSLCTRRPAEGSLSACSLGDNSMPCGGAEFCEFVAAGNPIGRCQNEQLRYFDSFCSWCSFFDVDGCCSAQSGSRYVDFARTMEARISASDSRIQPQSCRGAPETRVACLVDSICQESFSSTLQRVARDLVIDVDYRLDSPPVFPEGVIVRVKGGRFGAEGVELVFGVDFRFTDDLEFLQIIDLDKAPHEGEEIEIYYVTEAGADVPLTGACALRAP